MLKDEKCILAKIVIVFSLIVWFLTEGFSIFHLLTPEIVRITWCILGLMTGIGVIYSLKRWNFSGIFGAIRVKPGQMSLKSRWLEPVLVIACLLMGLITFILAITIVPNNWDSMTYHLARVANWIENASVEYYPTNNPRQLYYSAFTEYFVLHMCLVLKRDLFVNLVQWCGYIISAIIVYKISAGLKISRMGSLFAALLFMMCPLAIAESMTTQIDLFACMWILLFAYFILELGKADTPLMHKENIINLFFCACSVGFCYLTKSSVCFMIPFFLLWYLVVCIIKKEKWSSIFKAIILAAGMIVLLMVPSSVRNYKSTGNIFAYEQMAGNLMIKTANPRMLLLNLCKNLTMEMAGDNYPNLIWNATMDLADSLEVDVEDPQISAYPGFSEGTSCKKSYHQDTAGAQVLFILLGITLAAVVFKTLTASKKKEKRDYLAGTYLCAMLGSVCIMPIFIRWQPWGNRLLLPILPFICIFISYILNRYIKRDSVKKALICIILLLSVPDAYKTLRMQAVEYAKFAWEGQDRLALYFRNRGSSLKGYEALSEEIVQTKASDIGLLLSGDTYEYPLWTRLKNEETTLHHVVPEDPEILWYPQCIAAIDRDIRVGELIQYGEHEYRCIWNYEGDSNYAVLVDCDI